MKRREFSLTAAAVLVPAMLGATAARAQPAKPREGKDYLVVGKQAPTRAPPPPPPPPPPWRLRLSPMPCKRGSR